MIPASTSPSATVAGPVLMDQIDTLCQQLLSLLAGRPLPERWREHMDNARRFARSGEAGAARYELQVLARLVPA